jgi:hypothetical protein
MGKEIYVRQNAQTDSVTHPDSYLIGGEVFSPDVNRPRREVNHSRPSGTKVENEWSYTSASSIFLVGVDRGDFNFFTSL